MIPTLTIDRLLLTDALWDELVRSCPRDGLETGGKALGRFYTDGTAVACLHIGAGPDARRTAAAFIPDVPYQQACHDGLVRRYPQLRLTLDWHLHPNGPAALSGIDRSTIDGILGEEGWGLDALVFAVLTREGEVLVPHAFFARRRGEAGVELRPIEVGRIPESDPRVRALLTSPPERLEVVIPAETLAEVRAILRGAPKTGVDLYGYQRLGEGLIQVLATEAVLDAHRVGRAFARGAPQPLTAERELRLEVEEDGGLAGRLKLGGSPIPCEVSTVPLMAQIHARNEGVADRGLGAKRVAFVGAGSVGASLALSLAQAGVSGFTILDPDTFSAPNVARHPGDVRDLGRRKDRLLAERILARHPLADVRTPRLDVTRTHHAARCEEALGSADLLIVSTDEPTANLAANRLAAELAVPALFVGIFEGGIGGEILAYRPPRAGCYACVASFRAELPPVPRAERVHDYLNMRPGAELPPMHALAIDIGHTCAVAASVALGLLGDGARLEGLISPESSLLLVANGRADWIFTRPFEVIAAALERPGCPVCRPWLAEEELGEEDLAEEDLADGGQDPTGEPHRWQLHRSSRSAAGLSDPHSEEDEVDDVPGAERPQGPQPWLAGADAEGRAAGELDQERDPDPDEDGWDVGDDADEDEDEEDLRRYDPDDDAVLGSGACPEDASVEKLLQSGAPPRPLLERWARWFGVSTPAALPPPTPGVAAEPPPPGDAEEADAPPPRPLFRSRP